MCSVTEGSWGGTNRRWVSEQRKEGGMRMSRWSRVIAAVLMSGVVLLLSAGRLMALQVGDKAPDFSLPGSDGKTHKLADFKGRAVVLAWFPKAFTGG